MFPYFLKEKCKKNKECKTKNFTFIKPQIAFYLNLFNIKLIKISIIF